MFKTVLTLIVERIAENLDIRPLSKEDADELNAMDEGEKGRTVEGPAWGVKFF